MSCELYLVIRLAGVADRIHHVDASATTIGRDPGCMLHLPGDVVSRSHAVLLQTPTGYVIRDLGSRNGLRLNGHTVAETMLNGGTVVEIGPYQLMAFSDLASAQATANDSDESTRNQPIPILNKGELEQRVSKLSPTQRRVCVEFLQGRSEKEVARAMQISIHTVHAHAKVLHAKFAVSSRAELLALFSGHVTLHDDES